MSGPRGDAGPAAIASRDFKARRSGTGDCAGAEAPAQDATGVRPLAPADGLNAAAEAMTNAGAHARASAPSIYAALDLGTNNCRLLIAKPSRRGFLVIDAFYRIIRLGEGVLTSGRLSEAAMSRTIDALKVCADKMKRRGVTRSRLIATEACRIAGRNCGESLAGPRLTVAAVTKWLPVSKAGTIGASKFMDDYLSSPRRPSRR